MARGLKFCIKEQEGLYYLCSENKGADQLRGYREADLLLCFHICKKPVFSRRGSDDKNSIFFLLFPVVGGCVVWMTFQREDLSVSTLVSCSTIKELTKMARSMGTSIWPNWIILR